MAQQIAAIGGIITLPALPLQRHLVGHFEWVDDSTAFVFPAFGERSSDGQLIPFTEIAVTPTGTCFFDDRRITGYLSPIDKAAVEDPDDYRVAWRLWQEVVPRLGRLIAQSRDHCLAHCRGLSPRTGEAHPMRRF